MSYLALPLNVFWLIDLSHFNICSGVGVLSEWYRYFFWSLKAGVYLKKLNRLVIASGFG